jgi:hypothetical protein
VIGKRRIFTTKARRRAGELTNRKPRARRRFARMGADRRIEKLKPPIADDTDQADQIKGRLPKFQIGTRLACLGHCTKKTYSGLLPVL